MKINKNNYEAYFMDYLEGNLDESLVNDFIEFIRQNPELKKELALFDSVKLEPENLTFDKKNTLYKEIYDGENEFNRAAIANLEGDLSDNEKEAFENYLSTYPEKQKEAGQFALTRLFADEKIVFSKKNKLYHNSTRKVILLWSGRVAAVLVIALTIYSLFNRPEKDIAQKEQVAVLGDKNVSSETTTGKTEVLVENKQSTSTGITENKKIEPIKTENPVSIKSVNIPSKLVEEQLLGNNKSAAVRIPVKVPDKINALSPSFSSKQIETNLASIRIQFLPSDKNPEQELFIANVVKEKTGLDNLSFNKITKAGLKLVSAISKDKFSYETNNNGEITEVNFDTRLLAFSIPTKGNSKE